MIVDPDCTAHCKRLSVVRSDAADLRGWLLESVMCPLLAEHGIAHVGLMEAKRPFELIRKEQSGTFMLACFEGEGWVLVDGSWKKIRTGQACLLPPFVMNALKCKVAASWKFAWVRYHESRDSTPVVSSQSPVSGTFDAKPLKAAITGLHAECVSGAAQPSAVHHWCGLIQHYVMRFARPYQSDDRLWRLWQRVEAGLDRPWSLSVMARHACMSEEHLRRLCRKQLGRSPIRQLTFLRLQRARHLLSVTDDKVETIARAVGFKSVHTFSNTFQKWFGWRPSDHRKHGV